MSDQDDDTGDDSLAQRRTRRTRGDKSGKLAALEKLRNLRGAKNKYEVKEVENVYDEVDEDTYARKVNDRLQDDWIVDDGTGYCDNGHELFDDDLVDDDNYGGRRKQDRKSRAKKDKPTKEDKNKQKENFTSVRDMLCNMPVKRKRNDVGESSTGAADDDDLLGELMQELHEEKKPKTSLPSGLKLLERTKAAEKAVSAGRISEEKPFQTTPKVAIRKKFQAFKINEVKQEPIDVEDNDFGSFAEQDHSNDMMGDDFPEEEVMMEAAKMENQSLKKEVLDKKVDSTLKEIQEKVVVKEEFQLQEVEDFETFRQAPTTNVDVEVMDESADVIEDNSDQSNMLNFYWFDIYEEPKNPGVLYLFGKVKSEKQSQGFVSCCLVLTNVDRCLFLLPREEALNDEHEKEIFVDINNEFQNIASKNKIPVFRAKKAEKKYCFREKNVPSLAKYLEIRYSGTLPTLPDDLTGNTFSKVFGTSSSLLENFLLDKKFKGPCWLQINKPVLVESGKQQSWCKIEYTCPVSSVKIHPGKDNLKVPKFVVASLNINAVHDANSKKDTIISVCVAVNKSFNIQTSISSQGFFHDSFCLLNKPAGEVWPFDVDRVLDKFTTKMDSERGMLACLLAKLTLFDPDVYVGHDINLDLLLLQLWNHKVPHWSRIGRLKRSSQPQKGGRMPDSKAAIAGRLVCDVKISAMELIRARSYDLPSLSVQVLGMKEDQVITYEDAEMRTLFENSEGIKHLTQWGMSLCLLNLRLVNELQVMPLALQITTIAGNTLARTLMGGRSERNEFLLLHAFHSKQYIVPDKNSKFGRRFKQEPVDEGDTTTSDAKNDKSANKSSGPSYAGGLVLDPKKGFYDNFIVLMDFNSLYPSIIQEFNICFTTTTTDDNTDEGEKGILPEEIRKLVESRRHVKKLMQAENVSHELKRQYDIRQKALKLTANSMYGCLGFRNSRFYAKDLAALITGKGRDILLKTKDAVELMGFDVIYGDTDSIMINTNTQDVKKVYQIGNKIKAEINRMYKLLELEIDGIFRFLLLLKKKKYAAMLYNVKPSGEVEMVLELKGLDMVRRDWAPVAATTARAILDEIMSEQSVDDKTFKISKILNEKAEELRAGKVPINDLLITKQLAKNPEEYKGRQGLYHVQVALRMNESGKLAKKFKNGDTVPYLFCTDGLAHHPVEVRVSKVKVKKEEVKTDGQEVDSTVTELVPDAVYYLSQQVHPVVSRICEPIPGLDAARIAEDLGLDPSSYKRKRAVEENSEDRTLGEISETEKYRDCTRFSFQCFNNGCNQKITIESPLTEVNGEQTNTLGKCPGCATPLYTYIHRICNSLNLFIRKFIETYYQGWYMCQDPACPYRERAVSLRLENGFFTCQRCKQEVMQKEYSDYDLNKQLNYLVYIFDLEKRIAELPEDQKRKLVVDKDAQICLERLSAVARNYLHNSSYSQIRLQHLFVDLIPTDVFTFNKRATKFSVE